MNALQEHSSGPSAGNEAATPGWLAAGAATVAAGWLATRDGEPARAEAAAAVSARSGLVAANAKPRAASVSEGGGLSFSFLTPEYRRNVFFIYEKRLRVHSPPEKVFEYFSSVKSNEGRGSHSSTFQLNVSTSCPSDLLLGWFQTHKRLRLSKDVDECKPLKEGTFMSSIDLMRAAVPVFQPVNSTHIRSGFLGRGLHSFPFLLNLSLLRPIPLNLSLL